MFIWIVLIASKRQRSICRSWVYMMPTFLSLRDDHVADYLKEQRLCDR